MQKFQRADLGLGTFEEFKNDPKNDFLRQFSDQEIRMQYDRLKQDIIYLSDKYQVNVDFNTHRESPIGIPVIHLSIKRIDREPIHDWRELQEIKNIILGEEVDAVELYPAESRKVDMANQHHIWALPIGNFFPVGWMERSVTEDTTGINAKQRPFKVVK